MRTYEDINTMRELIPILNDYLIRINGLEFKVDKIPLVIEMLDICCLKKNLLPDRLRETIISRVFVFESEGSIDPAANYSQRLLAD